MKKNFALIFINILLVVLQNSFFNELFSARLNPNLVLAYGFTFLLMDSEQEGLTSLLIGGLLLDLLGFNTIGLSCFVLVLLFELSFILKKSISQLLLFKFLLIFISSMVFLVLSGSHNFFEIIFVSFVTLLASIVFYMLDVYILKFFSRSELGLLKTSYK